MSIIVSIHTPQRSSADFVFVRLKDNAYYLKSSMEFSKNGYTCCLDTTIHDKMGKSRGHHTHYVTTDYYIITRCYSLFL